MKPVVDRIEFKVVKYMIENKTTVREAAKYFGYSKSTISVYTERVKFLDPELYEKYEVLKEYNLSTKHIRGGDTTRKKHAYGAYENIK